jgi:hypothetical protein
LVAEGLDLNFVRRGISPLVQAIATENRSIVGYLLSHGAVLTARGNEHFLVAAAQSGSHDLLALGIAAGHDLHFRHARSTTPMEAAAFRNLTGTMKFLIAQGATKEDFDDRCCRWTSIRAETIQVLLDLGVSVPDDIVAHVQAGKW